MKCQVYFTKLVKYTCLGTYYVIRGSHNEEEAWRTSRHNYINFSEIFASSTWKLSLPYQLLNAVPNRLKCYKLQCLVIIFTEKIWNVFLSSMYFLQKVLTIYDIFLNQKAKVRFSKKGQQYNKKEQKLYKIGQKW